MTTANIDVKTDGNGVATMPRPETYFRFPDPPERTPDDMTTFNPLSASSNVGYLIRHFGNRDTTIVTGEHFVSLNVTGETAGTRYPDLLIAFDVDPVAYKERNAYVISEQGKPPDFVLEIASRKTAQTDVVNKRADYEALGIPEYWRFDETGRFHRTRLAGDRLVNGRYEPIPIVEVEEDVLQGYSAVLHLHLRWESGTLAWHDPETGRHILTIEDEAERADREQTRADRERTRADWQHARADREHARADRERARADQERARADDLQDQLRRIRGE